jgi:putative flippase GtrA|tara:strand:+ start:110 stop:487 length:378 start_codon:yes stop_codon:yes gene_type:complete
MIKHQFIKFLFTGLVSTAINYFSFYVFLIFFNLAVLTSSSIGYCIGLVCGYQLNKKWTFGIKEEVNWVLFLKYLLTYLLSLVLGLMTLDYLVNILNLNPLLANLIIIIQTTSTNFIIIKIFVFKQ